MRTLFDKGVPCKTRATSQNEGNEEDQLPDVGQIVAMVASNSTPQKPDIFLAKVLSYKNGEAQLHYLEKVPEEENLYRPSLGKDSVWWENSACIIWPIFCTFDKDSRGYILYSTKEEIADQVSSDKED